MAPYTQILSAVICISNFWVLYIHILRWFWDIIFVVNRYPDKSEYLRTEKSAGDAAIWHTVCAQEVVCSNLGRVRYFHNFCFCTIGTHIPIISIPLYIIWFRNFLIVNSPFASLVSNPLVQRLESMSLVLVAWVRIHWFDVLRVLVSTWHTAN